MDSARSNATNLAELRTSPGDQGTGQRYFQALKLALSLFLIAVCSLELANTPLAFKPWNITMVVGAAAAVCISLTASVAVYNAPSPRIFTADWIFLTYLMWCAITGFWSVSPADTLIQTFYLFMAWLGTLAVRTISIDYVLRALVTIGFSIAIISLIATVASPGTAFQPSYALFPELRGIFQHQQRLGLFMGICLGLVSIAAFNRKTRGVLTSSRLVNALIVLSMAFCAAWAFARLNMLFVVVSVILAIAFSLKLALRTIVAASVSLVVVLVAIFWDNIQTLIPGSSSDFTLTGRTNVWERTNDAISDGNSFGYGFATFNDASFDAYWGDYRAPSAHNSYLQTLFETGVIGVVLLAAVFVVQFASAVRIARLQGTVPYSLVLVTMSFLSSVTGVTYGGKPTILLVLTLLVLAVELQELSNARRAPGSSVAIRE